MGDREDWFTPVDGFVPSLGFGAAVFDHDEFNHTYLAGHISLKAASGRVGYAFGGERPVFADRKLFLGAEFHDLTASDDQWQMSSIEASLAAVGPRRNFRDYYRREGLQLTGALRVHPQAELLLAWRGERQSSLTTMSDFSFWNSDESFRPNLVAREGQMNAVILGASIDGRGSKRHTAAISSTRSSASASTIRNSMKMARRSGASTGRQRSRARADSVATSISSATSSTGVPGCSSANTRTSASVR
jgi:hypothetical protein